MFEGKLLALLVKAFVWVGLLVARTGLETVRLDSVMALRRMVGRDGERMSGLLYAKGVNGKGKGRWWRSCVECQIVMRDLCLQDVSMTTFDARMICGGESGAVR